MLAELSNGILVSRNGEILPFFVTILTNKHDREWVALTLVPILMLLGIAVSKTIYMPIWTYFIALGFGAAAMLPMSFVYAMSGFSIKVGYFNELLYGCELTEACVWLLHPTDKFTCSDMIDVKGSSRHPLGQLAYRIISGNVWYDARTVLEDQKVRLLTLPSINYKILIIDYRLAITFTYLPDRLSESKL